MRVIAVAFAFLLGSPQFNETIDVRLHNIDVVVTNDRGEPVTGLRTEDFVLLEDGVPQTITNFSAYAETVAINTPRAASTPPVIQAEAPPSRTIVFFIDELNLISGTRDALLKNLRAFVRTMRPGDRAAVVRAGNAIDIELQLTSDRASIEKQLGVALANAVETLQGNTGLSREYYWFRRHIANADNPDNRRAIARRAAATTLQRVKQRLGIMRAIIAAVAPEDGRKVLIAVTQSLSAEPGREFAEAYASSSIEFPSIVPEKLDDRELPDPRGQLRNMPDAPSRLSVRDLKPAIAELARIASTNGVTFYAIRPENDLTLRQATADLTTNVGSRGAVSVPADDPNVAFMQDAIQNTKRAIDPFVDITGGRHFAPNDRLDDAVQRIANDLSSYYSLAYHARGGFDAAHKIEVRVRNRPELFVRARSEVERKSAPRELTDRVVSSLITANAPNDLAIALRATTKKDNAIQIDVLIPLAALDFEQTGDVYRAHYSAHYAVTGKATDFFSGVDADRTITIPAADFANARKRNWTHTITMNGGEPAYRVAVGVMDLRSERTGIASMTVVRPQRRR